MVIAAHASLSELAARPRTPGTAVAFLVRTWSFLPAASTSTQELETGWQESADLLRSAGWRVISVEAGDMVADLWPAALASNGVRR